jgi:hypothetical protein
MFSKSVLIAASIAFSSTASVDLPPVGGLWSYGGGADGSARVIVSEKEILEIRLHWHPRKKAGEPEPHYILKVQARKSSENGSTIWPFDGTWSCGSSTMAGCDSKCDGGNVSGVVRSSKLIEITSAQDECKHNLSGTTLVK